MRLEDRGKNLWATFTADMARYGGGRRAWSPAFIRSLITEGYSHPGILAIVVYRFGQWVSYRCRIPIVRQICELYYYYLFTWVRFTLQIELPRSTAIDGGLRIDHFGGIIINSQAVAGKNFTITHGVLLGETDTGVPVLGDNVSLGVGARVIGGITLGNYVQVGCGAVVTKSFSDGAVVAGVPAKLLRYKPVPELADSHVFGDSGPKGNAPEEAPSDDTESLRGAVA
jgi:serine O-acetyltransferase